MAVTKHGTWYIPQEESRTVTFARCKIETEGPSIPLIDDRGTLYAFCWIDEADTDEMLALKQFDAGGLMEQLRTLAEYEDWTGDRPVRIYRGQSSYDVEIVGDKPSSASDAM